MFEKARKDQADDYAKMSVHARYCLSNDYIQFKRTWHDARYPDKDVPLPDASKWFSRDGEPIIELTGPSGEGDDDDDLVVAREVRGFKCPLSLQTMKEPYSSNKCSHTFDKANILGFIRERPWQGKVSCCRLRSSKSTFSLT